MSFRNITSRQAILDAVAEYDQIGRDVFLKKYEFGKSKDYFLIIDDRQYDAKAIVCAAHGYQYPQDGPLTPYSGLSGGKRIQRILESLGFTVRVSKATQVSQRSFSEPAPSAEQFASAFRKLGNVSDTQLQMLRLHYNAPERTITATEMAEAVGYSHYSIANSQYGRLGRLVGDQLEYNPMKEALGTLVTFEKRQGEWHWVMRSQVVEALERLGWGEGTAILLPEEITATTTPLVEGAVCRVTVNAYERNPQARRQCIEAHGTRCTICDFSFGKAYGDVAAGYIHVHHLRPLSEKGGEYTVDPVEDLRPVCPNCHAVLHRRIPAFSIEEVRTMLGGRIVRAIAANHLL